MCSRSNLGLTISKDAVIAAGTTHAVPAAVTFKFSQVEPWSHAVPVRTFPVVRNLLREEVTIES